MLKQQCTYHWRFYTGSRPMNSEGVGLGADQITEPEDE